VLAELINALKTSPFLREPLVHFLVLGTVLFGLYGWVRRDAPEPPQEVVVDSSRVAALRSEFERVWQRAPTPVELEGLVDNWVRDEIFYREGLALGLDRDDPVLRRRIAQKMSFMVEQLDNEPPTEEELQAWLRIHADNYRIEPAYSFRQIFIDPARHPDTLDETIERTRVALAAGADTRSVGDSTLLPGAMANVPATEIRRTFGDNFANALAEQAPGSWMGPIVSAYGAHLVYVDAATPARTATLADVRTAVERDFEADRLKRTEESVYEQLRERYVVRIDDRSLLDEGVKEGGASR